MLIHWVIVRDDDCEVHGEGDTAVEFRWYGARGHDLWGGTQPDPCYRNRYLTSVYPVL